jgi:SPP1 family phage portal protein
MDRLQNYIHEVYGNKQNWFELEVMKQSNSNRINNILNIKDYLSGKHSILNRETIIHNGKTYKSTAIVLQYAKPLLTFQTSFLFKNPITLTSDDNNTLTAMQEVYKTGAYNDLDYKVADKLNKYGQVFEYVYYADNGLIKSKLLPAEECYPVFDEETGEYIALIQYYTVTSSAVSYYTIFTEDKVYKYNNKGNVLRLQGEYDNLSGLPIMYIEPFENDDYMPHSDIEDYAGIIDNMESLLSKYFDSFYKFLNPIPVTTGTKLNIGKNGEGAIDKDIVGYALQLDDGSTFNLALGKMDYNSLKGLHDILMKDLLNISMTPAISMGASDIANLAETSIRMMYTLPIMKGAMKSKLLKAGFIERWNKIKRLLGYMSINVNGNMDGEFDYAIPENTQQIVADLIALKSNGLIDLDSALAQNPYVHNVSEVKSKLEAENNKTDKDNSDTSI